MKLRYQFLKKGEHTIVLPHFKNHHFTVVRIVVNLEEELFFKEISFFDSLNPVHKIHKVHGVSPMLKLIEQFLDYVVLWDMDVPPKQFNTFDVAMSILCPPQKNGYNCGLFTVVVVAYVIGGKEINTTNLRFPRNYNRDGDDLFPPEDIIHLMDEYTLAICEEEELVTEWEEGLEKELVEGSEEGDEDEIMFAGTKPASKPPSPSSPPVKLLKVQPAPKIPAPIIEHDKSKAAPRSIVEVDDDDQDQVQIDELRTLQEKLNKARYEFERSQQVLDAYKNQQKLMSEREEQEQEQEQEGEEQEEEDLEEQQEEEETQQPKQDLQFIKMYNE